MRKTSLSKMAVAAFLLTIGGTTAAKAVQQETRWFHVDSSGQPTGEAMSNPNCEQSGPLCSKEYFVDSENNPLEATGQEANGIPLQ